MIDRRQYAEERREQLTFLNSILGGFAFTISLACLQMTDPRMAINISAPFIILLAIAGYQKFPPSIQALREQAKADPKAKELEAHISSTDYGLWPLFKYFSPFVYGYGFFTTVLIFPEAMNNLINN